MKKVEISSEYIKLDSLLKFSGITITGGEAKEMILAGQILVNDEICLMRGKKIRAGDIVAVNGMRLEVVQGEGNPCSD